MRLFYSHAFPDPSQLLQSTDCSEEREEGLLGAPVAFCCVSTTLHTTLVATWFRLQTTTMPGMGPLSISRSRPPLALRLYLSRYNSSPRKWPQRHWCHRSWASPHVKLVANSAEPRQGFVFAKNVLGTQPVWVCTSLPTPRLHSYQGFLCPSAVAVTTVPSRGCHSSQVFSTGPPERAASPASQYQ